MLLQSRHFNRVLNDKLLLISLIDRLLTDILSDTRSMDSGASPFHCKDDAPSISVGDYLKRTTIDTQAFSSLRIAPTASSSSRSSTSIGFRRPSRDSCSTITASIGTVPPTQTPHQYCDGGCQVRRRLLLQKRVLRQDRRDYSAGDQPPRAGPAAAPQLQPVHLGGRALHLPRSPRGLPRRQRVPTPVSLPSLTL
jgi:hypothetical protein